MAKIGPHLPDIDYLARKCSICQTLAYQVTVSVNLSYYYCPQCKIDIEHIPYLNFTHVPRIDHQLSTLNQKGLVFQLIGESESGKTLFTVNIIKNMLNEKKKVLYCHYKILPQDFESKILAAQLEIPIERIRSKDPIPVPGYKLMEAQRILRGLRTKDILDYTSPTELMNQLKNLLVDEKVIVLDELMFFEIPQMRSVFHSLKEWADKYSLIILVINRFSVQDYDDYAPLNSQVDFWIEKNHYNETLNLEIIKNTLLRGSEISLSLTPDFACYLLSR